MLILKLKQIHEKFIDQEKKKEWKHFKNSVIKNIINKYGIKPGHGKYISKSNEEVQNKDLNKKIK